MDNFNITVFFFFWGGGGDGGRQYQYGKDLPNVIYYVNFFSFEKNYVNLYC